MATTVKIPLDLRNPRAASLAGNSWWSIKALTNIDVGFWEFLKDVDGKIYGVATAPPSLAASPAAKIVLLVGANATTGIARLNVATKCVADDAESVNVTLTADTAQDITMPVTARLGKKVTFSLGDLANIAANDLVFVEILHEGSHINDTLAQNTELYEAWLVVDIP